MIRIYALVVGFVLLSFAIVLGQTKSDVERQYGAPDSLGRYTVRAGVGMTIDLDDNGNVLKMMVKPISAKTDSNRPGEKSNVMSAETAQSIVNELAPSSKRGKYKGTGSAEFGCTSVNYQDYEKVLISVSNRCSQQGGGTYSVSLNWKHQ